MNTITPIRFIASKMKNYQHYNRQIATLDKKKSDWSHQRTFL
jgi:hypothetical protein